MSYRARKQRLARARALPEAEAANPGGQTTQMRLYTDFLDLNSS
jgi:hypothetical protein